MNKPDYIKQYYDWITKHNRKKDSTWSTEFNKHHIIPRAIGGKDNDDNIVWLESAAHLKAHELLFKAFFQQAIILAHTVVSMAGKDNCDSDVLSIAALDQYKVKVDTARKLTMKRTVYDVKTLAPIRIPYLNKTPTGYVDKTDGPRVYIFNSETGCTAQWPKDNIPTGWKTYSDASDDEKLKYFPKLYNSAVKSRERIPMKWIQNQTLKTSKLIPKDATVPTGWTLGMYYTDEMRTKMKAGGMQSKAKIQAVSNGGYRWVHAVDTHKNKLIGKNDILPVGYAEGQFNKQVWELQQQLDLLKHHT